MYVCMYVCLVPHLASLCLLVGAFNPFTFKVIINIYILIAILLFWICFCGSFFFLFCSLVTWWLSVVLCLDSSFFFVYVSIIDFQFGITMRFWYRSLYISKIVLSFWSLNFKCISSILHLRSPHSCWFWYHTCAWIIPYLYYMIVLTSELSHSLFSCFQLCIFFFTWRTSFSTVAKLVWWCWILLPLACL